MGLRSLGAARGLRSSVRRATARPLAVRDGFEPWRALYRTARWQRLAERVKAEARFCCARCGRLAAGPRELDCDHVRPVRDDPARFWDGPFEALCRSCHAAKKGEEAAGLHGGGRRAR